ncbi:MAG: RNA-binding transcriptional accessory protein [Clostridiales bacterium]|jgi:uncharacterized protein|nr:RNA-binding transcriptional accessory protein [Clostridiales bacterium]
MNIIDILAAEFSLQRWQAENIIKLIDDGNTIPFIARYRKESHGALDDQVLREFSEKLQYIRKLEERRKEVYDLIDGQQKMTSDIANMLEKAKTLSEIEDIYRPYRPKRRTRASIAREKGLEPLADIIFSQPSDSPEPIKIAEEYIDSDKGVVTAKEALGGALDIIAENISDNADIRRRLRNLYMLSGIVSVKASDEQSESVYTMYYDFCEPVGKIADHRVLAIDRGEKEGFLKVAITLDRIKSANVISSETLKANGSPCTETVRDAGNDAFDRLIHPSIEREVRANMTQRAAAAAIKLFAVNLRELLMQPPVKGKSALGLDPGYRTGCKVAAVDETGKVLETNIIYITHSDAQKNAAKTLIKRLINKYGIEIIAIGNGTASKETEIFAAEVLRELPGHNVRYMVVSEAGASVYSASKIAAEEFPQFDVSIRSAVSIARRLQDPLAELVKIDPQAIGVGQYQHDMPKKELGAALDGVVEDCVNKVGVDINTASAPLLSHVAGISAPVSKNIVAYREQNGAFTKRSQLKSVPKLGGRTFEQCVGFMRVPESDNALDNTGVHPESYGAAKELLRLCGLNISDIKSKKIDALNGKTEEIGGLKSIAEKLGVGVPTLSDIVKELLRPGRDPRDELPPPMLRIDVMDINDLSPGMEIKGTVRNVIDFGAFVDIGVHQDGLVHVSQITDKFIKHPSDVLKVGEVVTVRVLSVDAAKKRISLTMKQPREA